MNLHTDNKDRIRKTHKAVSLMLACLMLFAMTEGVQADERAYKVEAVFLYNFFNYVTWPGYRTPEDMKQATICITASDPVRPYLEYIQYRRSQERTLSIRQIGNEVSLAGCQMFFVREVNDRELAKLRLLAAQNGVLLVSTKPDFIDNGGMIGLSPEGERMAIEIDNSQLKQADFQVSSRLLDLARKVK